MDKELTSQLPPSIKEGYRFTTTDHKPVSQDLIFKLLEQEKAELSKNLASHSQHQSATIYTPLGVQSSFQFYKPFPINIKSASGAYLKDVDNRKILDLSMGFGAMLAGHLNPQVILDIQEALREGTLYVAPSPLAQQASASISKRFNISWVRFANSGTEAVMYAVRLAKVHSGKEGVVKIEGGYHGSADSVNFSVKPSKFTTKPQPVPGSLSGLSFAVPYNDLQTLEDLFKTYSSDLACFILEPVIENLGIILPDQGYLQKVRELCDKYNVILIFDEVKTGLTAGPQGAAQRLGVTPDLICLAKSIAGGIPLAAFGGKEEFYQTIDSGKMAHYGTFNGHNLGMAALLSMDKIISTQALQKAEALNLQALTKIHDIIQEYQLPAHALGFGLKGAISWSPTPLRNYKDWKLNTNFALAELSFFWSLNNLIMTPPGQDDQWLISLAHDQEEIDLIVQDFLSLAKALRS